MKPHKQTKEKNINKFSWHFSPEQRPTGRLCGMFGVGEKLKHIGKNLGGANIMRKDIKKGKKQI